MSSLFYIMFALFVLAISAGLMSAAIGCIRNGFFSLGFYAIALTGYGIFIVMCILHQV